MRLPLLLAVTIATLVVIGGPAPGPAAAGPQPTDLIALNLLADGIDRPTAMAHAGDERLFIIEREGIIRIWDGDELLDPPFLDASAVVGCCGGEDGMSGLAFHPDFLTNGRFFVHYANNASEVVVAEYNAPGGGNVANPAGTPIITIPHPLVTHNGGQLAFDDDGYLYVGIGDGGGNDDPDNNAQDLTLLLGKILRLDVDVPPESTDLYEIPADNPFVLDENARDEIWAYGFRNPWRFNFDDMTGELFIADVGEHAREEVNVEPAGAPGGGNYGWRLMEGDVCHEPATNCNDGTLILPAFTYDHSAGDCSIIGAGRYYGDAIPAIDEMYVYGDFCTGRIWGATLDAVSWSSQLLHDADFLISSFGFDGVGGLYVTDYGGGAIYKIGAVADADMDGVLDGADNCPDVANADQANHDRDFIDLPPSKAFDDVTWIDADGLGDACDDDDDNDGLTDAQEAATPCASASAATNALAIDSDGDGYVDGAECVLGTDPASAASVPPALPAADSDGDGISDAVETTLGTNPESADTDADGVNDGVEFLRLASDAGSPNTDADACPDGVEVASVNADFAVNSIDLLVVAQTFGPSTDPDYIFDFDINRDGSTNSIDLLLVARRFGEACDVD